MCHGKRKETGAEALNHDADPGRDTGITRILKQIVSEMKKRGKVILKSAAGKACRQLEKFLFFWLKLLAALRRFYGKIFFVFLDCGIYADFYEPSIKAEIVDYAREILQRERRGGDCQNNQVIDGRA